MTTIPLREAFGDDYKQASVSSIDLEAKKANLDNGEEVIYSHLVLATGTTGSYPATTDLKSLPELRTFNDEVATSVSSIKQGRNFVVQYLMFIVNTD